MGVLQTNILPIMRKLSRSTAVQCNEKQFKKMASL